MGKGKKIEFWDNHRTLYGYLEKQCSICGKWFPCTDEYFYINKSNKTDGLYPDCKKCEIIRSGEWERNPQNKDSVRKSAIKRNAKPEFKEKMRAYAKKQREDGYNKEYQFKNKDKIKIYNERRQIKNHNISENEWNTCLNYFNNSCAYCGITEINHKKKYNETLHKEHVEHDGANDLSNCIPACKSCNSQKWKFKLDDWYNQTNENYTDERYNKIEQWLEEDYKLYIDKI